VTTTPGQLVAEPADLLDDDPTVDSFMSRDVIAVGPAADPVTALRTMAGHHVHHLAVLEPRGVDGLLTETMATRAIADDRLGTPVGDLTVRLPRVRPRNRRSDAARIMYANGVDAVLVVDDDTVLGIVTATDLVRSLTGWCGPWQG
jgi:CBS domain-containing protein